MATIDIAMESTSQQILNKLNSSSGGGAPSGGVQTFTSNGTFTVPAGVTKIWVTAAGGGGGGGGAYGYSDLLWGGGGGGGSCIVSRPFNVTPGQSIAITIGAGGAGGTASWRGTPTDGGAGGSTVIGNLITLPGGQGGKYSGAGGNGGIGAGGGAAGMGYSVSTRRGGTGYQAGESYITFPAYNGTGSSAITFPYIGQGGSSIYGAIGGTQYEYSIGNFTGGAGGGASIGNGGNGGWVNSRTPVAATVGTYGGGGGGACNSGDWSANGAAGGAGIVIIEW